MALGAAAAAARSAGWPQMMLPKASPPSPRSGPGPRPSPESAASRLPESSSARGTVSWLLGGAGGANTQGGAPVQAGQGGGRACDARSQRTHMQVRDWGRWRADLRRSPDAAEGGRSRPSSSAGSGDAPAPRMPRWPAQGVALRFASMSRPGLRGLRLRKIAAAGPSSAREMARFTRALRPWRSL